MPVKIKIPGYGDCDGDVPIVILGPNGSGKTQLAQKMAQANSFSTIGAQRRTWVDNQLPVQEERGLRDQARSHIDRWKTCSWQPTEEIDFILSTLIQAHASVLNEKNEEAIASGKPFEAVKNTKLIQLRELWSRLFPNRRLELAVFPKVTRLDAASTTGSPYQLQQMSDGERTVLYMGARVLTADQPVILVDEPELHMHSRLSVQFWDEAEKLRPDCRFVYITHDLSFTLSRRRALILLAQSSQAATLIPVDRIPSSVAAEVLGAATLPFYAKRIFLFEGESGKGFASEFFSAWFDGNETFALPCGNRVSVFAAVSGLRAVGLVGAEVIGLVDRDFYSDEVLGAVTQGVTVLQLHEVESMLCDERVVFAFAEHFGKDPGQVWRDFLDRVRMGFRNQTFNGVVAHRVRARVRDLLDGAFSGSQVVSDLEATTNNHCTTLTGLDLPKKVETMFAEEARRVTRAVQRGGPEMLAILPGKHMLSLLPDVLGLRDSSELTGLVARSLDRKWLEKEDALSSLGSKIEKALLPYLPPRRV